MKNTNRNSKTQIRYDKKRFSEIYEKYHKQIQHFFIKRVGTYESAEDLTSEVFEKAFKAYNDFKWQGVSISSWLFKIARNLLIDHYRKKSKIGGDIPLDKVANIIPNPDPEVYQDYIKDQEEMVLFDCLREFDDEEQYLIFYKFFEGLSNIDIAKITGLAESNVGTKLYRIRKKLKKILESKKLFSG